MKQTSQNLTASCFIWVDDSHSVQGDASDSCARTQTVAASVQRVLKVSWLQKILPPKWGVRIETQWKESAGFSHPSIRTAAGAPAFILSATEIHPDSIDSLVSHELSHLVQYHHRDPHQNERWIREGTAMVFQWRVTSEFGSAQFHASMNAGIQFPETSLIEVSSPEEPKYKEESERMAQYGHIFGFFYYLYRNCGGLDTIQTLITSKSSKTGIDFLQETLESNSNAECRNFGEVFVRFSKARFLQGLDEADYVFISSESAPIRQTPYSNLPPYSSSAYYPKFGSGCAPGDTRVYDFCVKIRLE